MQRRFGLLPRDESFFELFEQQAAVLRECLPTLAAMRETDIVDPHWATGMQAIEQRGDQLTSSLIRKAEQTFITPLDREDILALAVAVDLDHRGTGHLSGESLDRVQGRDPLP
jgi:uncharacterized protein